MKNLEKLAMSTATNFYYLSPRIKELKELKKLIFIKSHIDSIPPEIGELSNLEVLQISWGRGIRFLPAEIGGLKNLEYLGLTRNQLTTLPEQIKYLTKLKRLDLRENNFSVEERQRIKKLLPNCKIIFEY
ncbi:MAG: leucine-rich repeat domain-containing protein [Chitinophagales bacterium]|nr:leucine-rich repeat domain-containing protein [Chitinophagales bacterium]